MTADFSVTVQIEKNTLLIITSGYINNLGGEKILKSFQDNFSDAVNKVIIDLENSKVVNSIGISFLIEIIEVISESNSKLYFTKLEPTVKKTFEIMGLLDYAEII